MASGYVHNRVTMAASALSFVAVLVTAGPAMALATAGGCALGVLLTPDLDQQTYSAIENKMRKSRNPLIKLLGWVYIGFFYPYAKAIPHRSKLSHAPLVSTAFRVLYVVCVIAIALGLLTLVTPFSPVYVFITFLLYAGSNTAFWYAIAGLATSDMLHWLFDRSFMRSLAMKMDSAKNKSYHRRRKSK